MKSVKPKDNSGEPPAQGGGRNAEATFLLNPMYLGLQRLSRAVK
jgi:hypothetical protein